MTRWFERAWTESRGDEYDDWGAATYYFEVDDHGNALRQLEVYLAGQRLQYTLDHRLDDYGMLTDQPLDFDDFGSFEIDEATFSAAWLAGPATNRAD